MRLSHFEAFRPICPRCRRDHGATEPLVLAHIHAEDADGQVAAGIIHCPACFQEYPIIDGLPLLVPDVRGYVAQALPLLMARDDLPAGIESLLGDCAGAGSAFDSVRQHLSSYGWDHYADLDPTEPAGEDAPGAVARCLHTALDLLGRPPAGPAVELGCGPGRATFELAARLDGPVLGVDLSFPLAALAAGVLRRGRVRYPRRRIGVVYDRHDFAVALPDAERVDFWVADALALPFADGQFGLAIGLNLLDCLPAPVDGVAALGRLLRPEGRAVLACPYDWSPSVTPMEQWLGGHSQRGAHGGAAEPLLRHVLADGAHGLRLTAEAPDVPWQVRLHDRALMRYRAHVVSVEKAGIS